MNVNHVMMLIIGVVVLALGMFLVMDFVPGYEADFNDRVCYVFSLTRGMIFRDKGDYIPNEFERKAYDALASFIPLPCTSKSFKVNRADFGSNDEFYKNLVETISKQVIRCNSLFSFGDNNPLYPGGSGRNPFVCATISYSGASISNVNTLMEDINDFKLSTQKLENKTVGDTILLYYMNDLFDKNCDECWWAGDYRPNADAICKTELCLYGSSISSYFTATETALRGNGVLYVTYLDFPGKIMSKMDIGNNACGFFNIQPAGGTRAWRMSEAFVDWETTEVEPKDRVLICYESLNI